MPGRVFGTHTIITGASCYGNISALDPATGAFVWRSCQTSFMTAGLTEVPGLLIEGVGAGGNIVFLNTANGATRFTYNAKNMVQGEVTVSNGIVYAPLANGNLIALGQSRTRTLRVQTPRSSSHLRVPTGVATLAAAAQ